MFIIILGSPISGYKTFIFKVFFVPNKYAREYQVEITLSRHSISLHINSQSAGDKVKKKRWRQRVVSGSHAGPNLFNKHTVWHKITTSFWF